MIDQFVKFTFWILPAYVVLAVVLLIVYIVFNANKKHLHSVQKISAIANIIFSAWLIITFILMIKDIMFENGQYDAEVLKEGWPLLVAMLVSVFVLLYRKNKRSPYAMIAVCAVLLAGWGCFMLTFKLDRLF